MMKKGTTLIELVIAMGIIITGILTVVGLITRSITLGSQTKNDLVAIGLAQEGIEAARAVRDGNALINESGGNEVWNLGLFNEPVSGRYDYTAIPSVLFDYSSDRNGLILGPWAFNFSPDTTSEDDARIFQYVNVDFDGLFYQDVGVTPDPLDHAPTEYRRIVTLEPICISGNTLTEELAPTPIDLSDTDATCASGQVGVRVSSLVEWPGQNGTTDSLTLTQDLYDWR